MSAHPDPPMNPELTQNPPLTQWVWVGRGFGWAGFEIPVSDDHSVEQDRV